VEPWPEQRQQLLEVSGADRIPVLVTEDGTLHRGIREIFDYLRGREPWRFEAAHRRRFIDHADARANDASGQLVESFRGVGELEAAEGSVEEAVVADAPESGRYELRLDGRLIGLLAYRRREGVIAFTHTEVVEVCEGRGFGSLLVGAALDDARRQGLEVVPLCPFVTYYISRHPEYEDLAPGLVET
jgi:uncharacterized protein